MYQNTTFSQIINPLKKGLFSNIVSRLNGDKFSKGFSCWDQLLVMVFAQLTKQDSLRSTVFSFNEHKCAHYHLGTKEVSRSTLSYANSKRDYQIYSETLKSLISLAGRGIRKETDCLLKVIDSTSLKFDPKTAHELLKSNGRVYGIKLHVEYEIDEQVPTFYELTPANVNDIVAARSIKICPGATYVFDRGYMDFRWWDELTLQGCRFVSRMQRSVAYEIVEERSIDADTNVKKDYIIRLSGKGTRKKYDRELRLISIEMTNGKQINVVSNDLLSSSAHIAHLYSRRWEIETLFKWIKQSLKIKQFMFDNPNAILIQILTAMITYVLLALYRASNCSSSSLREVLLLVRNNLFVNLFIKENKEKRKSYEKIQANKQLAFGF